MTSIRKSADCAGPHTMRRWFGAARKASIAYVKRFHAGPPPPTLFHYTSTAALISIVRENELWLSDATFLNDRVEIAHGRTIAHSRLQSAMAHEQRPAVRSMLEVALAKFEGQPDPPVYVACFSLEGDDLTQWRGYGQGNAPIAIELEHGPLMFGYTSEGLLQQVIYETEAQAWIFDQIFSAYSVAYDEDLRDPRPKSRIKSDPVEEEAALCAESLYHTIWRYITACKDPAFRSEREVRFTYTAHDFSSDGRDWSPKHPVPMSCEQAARIVPFLSSKNLHFQNMQRVDEAPQLPIRSIRVGPMEDQYLLVRGVRGLLDAHDFKNVAITASSSPFRAR